MACYGSRSLRKARDSNHKLEFLVLCWAVTNQFHLYIFAAPHVTVTTDHNPLTFVMTSAKLDAVDSLAINIGEEIGGTDLPIVSL